MESRPTGYGFTLLEVIVATVLIGSLLATLAPMLRWAGNQRQEAARQQLAQQAANNLLERLAAGGWETLDERAAAAALPDRARTLLREPELRVAVSDPDGTPAARRIDVELSWPDRSGRHALPVRLTTWVYRPLEAE